MMSSGDVETSASEIMRSMNEGGLSMGPEITRAVIAAGVSVQVLVTLGLRLLTQTAALTWSPDHAICNFEVGMTDSTVCS
jgi:hypothetical protein